MFVFSVGLNGIWTGLVDPLEHDHWCGKMSYMPVDFAILHNGILYALS